MNQKTVKHSKSLDHEQTIIHLNELNALKTRQIEDLMKFIAHVFNKETETTPMKVEEPYKQHDETLIGECPHCTAFVQSRNYCGHCGQKLDWSEE